MIIKKGQMITFAEGEYSDYCVEALVSAIKEFNVKEKQAEWEREHTELKECTNRSRPIKKVIGTAFLPWLASQGLIEDVDYIEIHTGYYGVVSIASGGED